MWFPFQCFLFLIDDEEDERHSSIPSFHDFIIHSLGRIVLYEKGYASNSTLIEGLGVASYSKFLCN